MQRDQTHFYVFPFHFEMWPFKQEIDGNAACKILVHTMLYCTVGCPSPVHRPLPPPICHFV